MTTSRPDLGRLLLLGGQLHNSTSSDLGRTREAFDRVVALGSNAVTATVSWHLVEPVEGEFDFSDVDTILALARERGLALTLLWFGAFKNAASTYAPRWVRADTVRFPRALLSLPDSASAASADEDAPALPAFTRPGTPVLSVFSSELRAADRRAFTALTRHLAQVDTAGTVVMVQVENEVGLLGAARDHCEVAQEAWSAPVPETLISWLAEHTGATGSASRLWRERGQQRTGSWAEVFGDSPQAQEVFMAWAFASYCEELAAAGAEHLDVVYYANAWLGPQPGQDLPGQYPSGGPVAGVVDVWKAAAPTLALVAPDIYVDDVKGAVAGYCRQDNALMVPESRLAVGNVMWAVGSGAVGFDVFGIEDVRPDGQLADAYRLLVGAREIVVEAREQGRLHPVLLEAGETTTIEVGGLAWTLRGAADVLERMFLDAGVQMKIEPSVQVETVPEARVPVMTDTRPMGVLVDLGEDEVLLIGQGLMVDIADLDGHVVEIDDAVEGRYVDGQWVRGRVLNGDERLSLLPLDELAAVRVRALRVM
ncbi:MAG: DUF5597 domain-containing protein [Actinomycetaceae bacterium]|nr:DUF5597 domain-containing protein [Actinomycetaceae bacterium]